MSLLRSVRGQRFQVFRAASGLLVLLVFFLMPVIAKADRLFVYERDGRIVITNHDVPPNTIMLRISDYSCESYSGSSKKETPIKPAEQAAIKEQPSPPPDSPPVKVVALEPPKVDPQPDVPLVEAPPDPPKEDPPEIVSIPLPMPVVTPQRSFYITRTGKRYHSNPSCGGGSGFPATLDEISRRGLTPCGRCL